MGGPNASLLGEGFLLGLAREGGRSWLVLFRPAPGRSYCGRVSTAESPRPGKGLALSEAEEHRRRTDHPGVTFQDGMTGRRAVLRAGPDVWEVVRAVRSTRSGSTATSREIVDAVHRGSGLPTSAIEAALQYAAAFEDEISAQIAENEAAEARLRRQLQERAAAATG